ncbi:tRNA-dependent cyclodipeptide synthase [Nocardiopsis gilva YIM 90087]|uniref:Cyclodipeptide synthase n=1 Tax=Nocardiopsis gilva YIM 90087 TaxID=1235441 RepID=A0A223S142_9ACTN|nr:tRNA-dependent cyclodipeptide synthase [Nocardiopsis gilva]ASU81838.1 tRNA-dependent cyclodipeptide synthase [Nocardiopsis gilva YIM 90087]
MLVRPLSPYCVPALAERTHACLGISPFNGYFTTGRIRDLAAWALNRFESMHLYMPDGPTATTLAALGYAPARAAAKARSQCRYLRNKMVRALDDLGVPAPEELILDSAALADNTRYQELLNDAHALFDHDSEFRRSCLEAARWVLHGRIAPDEMSQERLRTAVPYLLAELPLFSHTPEIVDVSVSVFCYHRPPEFVEHLVHRRLAWCPLPKQGFAVVTRP